MNMKETMYIGSGDVKDLMAGKATKAHARLMQRFVSGVKPYYNAFASPIDALRTGAILEERYLLTLPEGYYAQYVVVSDDMDVFKCSLDFAKIENGKVVDFDELKSISFGDFIEYIEPIRGDNDALVDFLKRKHKAYYYQIQEQLCCTCLQSANLVFLSVDTYDDEENRTRIIQENEYCKVRVSRDDTTIEEIKERGKIFQMIKDCYK